MTNETDTMTERRTLDLGPLLEPIPGENPAGESVRYEGTYDAIQEARREDDPTLPQGVWKTELKEADWREVETLCTAALAEKTKDLQITAWLSEAWIRRFEAVGAAAGFDLIRGLCERFWDDLYPALDAEDMDARLAPIEWLNDKLLPALKTIRIAEKGASTAGVSWADWEMAIHHEGRDPESAKSTEDDDEAGLSRRDALMDYIHATSSDFYRSASGDIKHAQESLDSLAAALDERCGDQTPSLRQLSDLLEEVGHFVGRIVKERDAMEEEIRTPLSESVGPGGSSPSHDQSDQEAVELPTGPLTSRAEAYQLLALAADYLTMHEPHSPAPYLVRRAIKWGRMSLAELLRELLRDNADLPTVYTLLGIRDTDSLSE